MIRIIAATADTDLSDRLVKAMDGLAAVLRCEPDSQALRDTMSRAKPDMMIVDVEPAFGATLSPAGARIATPDATGLIQLLRELDPQLLIIAVGDEAQAPRVLKAIRSGARDFISQDSGAEQFRSLLSSHLGHAPRRDTTGLGRLTCVIGDDSVAGGSFFATNYAVARAAQGHDTLLIDCTLPSTEAGAALDLTFSYTVRDAIHDLSRLDRTLLSSTLGRHAGSGLHVLPLAISGEDVGDLTPSAILSMLTVIRGLFTEVIVNAGGIRHPGILTELLQTSTDMFLVATQKFTSLKSCKELLLQLAPPPPVMARFILVVDDYHDAITLTEQQIAAALGVDRSTRLPAARAALVNALNRGKPLVLEERRHAYSRAIARLAGGSTPAPAPRTERRPVRQLFGRMVPHAS